ncbi:MAG: hypothetical protein ACLGPL_08750 [Acidobacteriota bacterium]
MEKGRLPLILRSRGGPGWIAAALLLARLLAPGMEAGTNPPGVLLAEMRETKDSVTYSTSPVEKAEEMKKEEQRKEDLSWEMLIQNPSVFDAYDRRYRGRGGVVNGGPDSGDRP